VENEKIGLIINQGIRVKLDIRVRLKLGQNPTTTNKKLVNLYIYNIPMCH